MFAQDAGLPAPSTAIVFGQRIRYVDTGAGPVVVLLHGLGSSAAGDWGRVIIPLSSSHRVIAPDQLGFGQSDKPVIDYRIQTWVDSLGEFLRQKAISHFTLVGESLGGWVAAQYAIQSLGAGRPGSEFALPKPDRLILCDAAGFSRRGTGEAQGPMDTSTLEGCRRLLTAIFFDPAWHTDAAVRAFYERSLAKGDGYTVHSIMTNPAAALDEVDGKLGAIRIPTLVVWGAHDALVPLDDGRRYAAEIPGARLAVVPNAGHAACVETPSAFLSLVIPFLDTAQPKGE